jgi:hypothetical protein
MELPPRYVHSSQSRYMASLSSHKVTLRTPNTKLKHGEDVQSLHGIQSQMKTSRFSTSISFVLVASRIVSDTPAKITYWNRALDAYTVGVEFRYYVSAWTPYKVADSSSCCFEALATFLVTARSPCNTGTRHACRLGAAPFDMAEQSAFKFQL